MPERIHINKILIRLEMGDITELAVDAFVYYARHDLALGSGFGGAIAVRGGPAISEELKKLGVIETTCAVMTSGGNLKARHIIHAVGPRFQEENLERKLKQTVEGVLILANKNKISRLALPAMGTGFYGIPLDICAEAMFTSIRTYLGAAGGATSIREIVICLNDLREYRSFANRLSLLGQESEVAS